MEIPDLSLRSTFSPPYYKDQASSSPCMCKYTIYSLDCGHPAEDHVDTKDCPHFQRTGVPCDRENPANRGRVNIKSEHRSGLCNICLRQRRKSQQDAVSRDEDLAKQQSLVEAQERDKAAKAHEERMLKESAEEYERLRRKREQEDLDYMLQKSREEAAALREQKEREDLARALEESCRLGPADRNVTVDEKVTKGQQEVTGGTLYWTRTDTTTTTETKRQHIPIPPPPPPPKAPAQLPSPPQTPVKTVPPQRAPPIEKPAAPVDFSAPASGVQDYGHYTIGGRRQPIHESQKQQAAKYLSSPSTPISPAPIVRLGSGVQPSSPSRRQMSVGSAAAVPVGDLRSALRKTGGPRQSMPSRTASGEENELKRHLARRRTWEPRDDISETAWGRTSRAGSVVSDLSRPSTGHEQSSVKDMDEQRRRGWN